MTRFLTIATVGVVAVSICCIGCSSSDTSKETASVSPKKTASASKRQTARPNNTKRLKGGELEDKLMSAGLQVKDLGPAQLSMDDVSRFPEEARSTRVLRISDGNGNSEGMTFVEFGSWKTAAEVDKKPINGFAVRNYFVVGTVSKRFVGVVTDALDN